MNRKDREITSTEEILSVLERCDTLHIGIGGEEVYVVPVSFGLCVEGERITLYVHGAKDGKKLQMLREKPDVCVEGDIFHGIARTKDGITTRYESIIASGHFYEVTDDDEKRRGILSILAHYGEADYPLDRCKGYDHTLVFGIELTDIHGKHNLPE